MLKSFLNKSLGNWESHRVYMYPTSGRIDYSVTMFTWSEKSGIYTVDWDNEKLKSSNSMSIRIKNDFTLERSRGYFTEDITESNIIMSNNNVLQTHTTYNGTLFDELIQFLGPDNRFRRTLAYKLDDTGLITGECYLAGTYMEKRVCLDLDADEADKTEAE